MQRIQFQITGFIFYFHLCTMKKHVSFFVLIFTFWWRGVVIVSWTKSTKALFLRGKSPAREKGLNLTLCLQRSHLVSFFPPLCFTKKSLTYFIWIMVSTPSLSFLWGEEEKDCRDWRFNFHLSRMKSLNEHTL